MDNFFKSLKDNLENRATTDFNPAAWDRMKTKMGESNPSTHAPNNSSNRWIPLLALLLTGSTILNYWFFSNSNNPISNSEKISFIHQIDTVVQTNILYKTDTIFKTKYVEIEKIVSRPSNAPTKIINHSVFSADETNTEFIHHTLIGFQTKFANPLVNNQYSNNSFAALLGLPSNSFNRELGEDLNRDKNLITPFSQLSSQNESYINTPALSHELEQQAARLAIYKKSFGEMIYPMRPQSFKLGVNAGIIKSVGTNIESENNYNFSIEPSIVFTENLELFGELAIHNREFETKSMNGLPDVDPGEAEAEFENAQISQNVFQYGMGMKYFFLKNKRFRPYAGVGFYGSRISNYEVQYTFEIDEDNAGGGNNEDEDEIEINQNFNDFSINNQLLVRSGLEYRFFNKWYLQFDASYNFNLNQPAVITPEILGFKTGIYRKF